jgi:hypothetical protein
MRAVVVTEAGSVADLAVAAGLRHGNPVGPGAIPDIEGAGEVAEHTLAYPLECFEAVPA